MTPRELHVLDARGVVVLKLVAPTVPAWRCAQRWAQEAAALCRGTVRLAQVRP